ncbi:MAG: glycosyltransferase family 4 protein [Acidobacteriota bacterium]
MRVLLVANTLPPSDLSGAGEQVVQLATGLRAAGCDVRILGRGEDGARGSKLLFPLRVVPAAWRWLRTFKPDVVQVHESDAALVAVLVRVLRAVGLLRPWPRLVALQQVSYREEIRSTRALRFAGRVLGEPGAVERRFRYTKGPLQWLLGRWTARLADQVLAPSRKTAAELERDYRVSDVDVLPNVTGGLEITTEPPSDNDEPSGYLLYVGRLRIRKAVEVLLEALAEVRARHPDVRVLIAGDGEQREALERRARELGLGDTVRFLGRASAARVRRLLASARALAVPSIYEGMPLVILEAMEAAVPVVATTVSGIPEVVVDGETGWLVPPEHPPELARALIEVLADPSRATTRGEAGQRRLDELYRPDVVAARWLEIVV